MVITSGVEDGLYQLRLEEKQIPSINLGVKVPLEVWHARLGHNNERLTKDIVNDFSLPVSTKCMKKCQSCIIGKIHQDSYPSRINKDLLPLDLVFADVWGPALMTLAFGCRYYVLFVNKANRYNWVFPVE